MAEASDAKRRKIRKGTRSCWECKRRKIRCIYPSLTSDSSPDGVGDQNDPDAVCIGCQRRGTSCVGQEFPEDTAPLSGDRGRPMGDRIVRVEALIEQLVRKVGSNGASVLETGIPTPGSSSDRESEAGKVMSLYGPSPDGLSLETEHIDDLRSTSLVGLPGAGKYETLSRALHAALPSREDIDIMCKAGDHIAIHFHQIMTTSYKCIEQYGFNTPGLISKIPSPDTHPTLIAKYMLIFATFLQYLSPEQQNLMVGVSEPPRTIMKRLANTAISLVTTNDELLGTIEGLECIMLEGSWLANGGNLRRSWMAMRRAMVIAQLMGLHRKRGAVPPLKKLDPNSNVNGKFLWFRVIMADRHLCLMLGLPQGSIDNGFASEEELAQDTSLGRLERIHAAIASRILQRNESCDCQNGDDQAEVTRAIDVELQQAAKKMPPKWWLVPNLAEGARDSRALFTNSIRLVDQLFHYNLLNQLHLPYMLRVPEGDPHKYDYSKMTCVNASRDVLARWVTFRSVNRVAFCCRMVDFFALMAAMTLILAHLDSHSSRGGEGQRFNYLAHQRLGDRAMMEQVLESMELVSKLNDDTLSEKSGELLRQLLAIEAEAAEGQAYGVPRLFPEGTPTSSEQSQSTGGNVLRMNIPYFGVIKIAREGGISRLRPSTSPPGTQTPMNSAPASASASTIDAQHSQPARDSHSSAPSASAGTGAQTPIPGFATIGYRKENCAGIIAPLENEPNYSSIQQPSLDVPSHPAPQTTAVPEISPATAASLPSTFAPQFPTAIQDALDAQYQYPGLTAGADDWAFQGAEMTFFDILTRGSGDGSVAPAGTGSGGGGGGDGAEWAGWQW